MLPPEYSSENTNLTISRAGEKGVVYYTTDGADPRVWDLTASISDKAIPINGEDTTILITEATTIKARTKNNNEWSPLHKVLVLTDGTITHEHTNRDEIEIPEIIDPEISNLTKVDITKKLRLYPNPVSDKLFLPEEKYFKVYSSFGTLLLQGSGASIPMKNLPYGLYFIIIDNVSYKILKKD